MNSFTPQPLQPSGLGDPVALNNMSPNQYRKPPQEQSYLNWQQHPPPQQQQPNFHTPHSSTPPPPSMHRQNQHQQTPTRSFSTNTTQFYDTNLITPQQSQLHPQFLHQQHSLDYPINNLISSNQLLMQQQQQSQQIPHPAIDPMITGHKQSNDRKFCIYI